MKTLLVLLLLGAGGYFSYQYFTKADNPYDISEENPLGTFEKLDQHLKEIGLERDELKAPNSDEIYSSYVYKDKERTRLSLMRQEVMIYMDNAGKMMGVGAIYTTGEAGGSKIVTGFINAMWRRYSDEALRFSPETEGEGMFARTFQTARFTKGEVEGKWMKDAGYGVFIQIMRK